MKYLKSSEICSELKISPATLKMWKDSGKISYKKLTTKKYLYDIDSILFDSSISTDVAIYGRVSTTSQKDDLDRQLELLKSYCFSKGIKPQYIISDIASGLNENRKGFNDLMNLVFDRKISKIFITYKDRLSRFGFDYFKSRTERQRWSSAPDPGNTGGFFSASGGLGRFPAPAGWQFSPVPTCAGSDGCTLAFCRCR